MELDKDKLVEGVSQGFFLKLQELQRTRAAYYHGSELAEAIHKGVENAVYLVFDPWNGEQANFRESVLKAFREGVAAGVKEYLKNINWKPEK